jgi:hypothetical protein
LDAVQEVERLLKAGYREVLDADLSGYCDSIPHAELMQSVARRVSDKAVLHLMKMWLVVPVEERSTACRVVVSSMFQAESLGIQYGASGLGGGTGSGRGVFRCLAAGPFRARALPAAAVFSAPAGLGLGFHALHASG